METVLGIAAGLGLSAACGFRSFVPLLVMNLASLSGQLHLSREFAWIGSYYSTVRVGRIAAPPYHLSASVGDLGLILTFNP